MNPSLVWKGAPYKPLTQGLQKHGGRNHQGRITVRHRGGGHKRVYRLIEFKRTPQEDLKVERIEYDPNRTGYIALVKSTKGYQYILAAEGLTIGKIEPGRVGSTLLLKQIKVGEKIYQIEKTPGQGGILCRAAGTFATLISHHQDKTQILLPSQELITVSSNCKASLGRVSHITHSLHPLHKAGEARWRGRRPSVRGEAMNPVDHPHGGKTKRGRIPKTPWGKITRG
jgi:large subunit ribosomal protein L2